jgi:hypothetical protein
LERIRQQLSGDSRIISVVDFATLHLGPTSILVALTLTFKSPLTAIDVRHAIEDVTAALQKVDGRITHVDVRPIPDSGRGH